MGEELKKTILALETISKRLEPDEKTRNEFINQVHNYCNHYINQLDQLPAYSNKKEEPGVFAINNKTESLNDLLDLFAKEVVEKGIKPASGGHIGYIPGGGIFTSALADYLGDITNVYTGIHFASPGGVAIEYELLNWMKSVFGFPSSATGNLTSGGSIANMIALTAARDKYAIKSAMIPKSVIYLSEQVHHCIFKALRIIGLEDIIIRYLELDEFSRIKPMDLESKIKKDKEDGLNPFLIISSAGTTDTGAIDPLEEIGQIARRFKMWYHIDGAYGGFFILTPQKKDCFRGIEMADSLVIDPHKGLFLPYGLGAVLVKDKEAIFHSNHYSANYMQDAFDGGKIFSPADLSPELTKPFRSLRLWLPLKIHGIEPFVACLEEKLYLTQYFRNELMKMGFRLGPEPDLSVSYFWYPRNNHLAENLFNERLMKEIHIDGEIFLSSTKIKEKYVIRMAILSFRTKISTIDKALAMIKRVLEKLKINEE